MERLAIGQMAAALAHEVKNPLSLVRANIDYLETEDESKHIRNFTLIKSELEKIDQLIMAFLSITKPKEEVHDLVYLYDILDEAAQKYAQTYPDIAFDLQATDTELMVEGNFTSLNILFDNIIKNALEAIGTEGIKGKVSMMLSEANDKINIQVKDTGGGIPTHIEDKIQDNFFTTKKGGTGLGLSICSKIAQEHGGQFEIKNAGDGAAVTIELPSYHLM